MKKKIWILLIIVVIIAMVLGIVFIQKNKKDIQINIQDLANRIVGSASFEDQLAQADSEMVMNDYTFTSDEINDLVSYQGSGATSEELVILQVKDKSKINSVKEKINTRLSERREAFESYLPKEVGKIDNNILRVEGNYIILCIANDTNTVNKIINEYIK